MADEREVAGPIRADYPEPLWVQAVDLITKQIESGALQPGARLPPERELCQQLNISRVTLRKALNRLIEVGIVSASHGRGWFVSAGVSRKEWPNSLESFTETAKRMGLVASSTVLRAESSAATLDEAEELSIAPGTPLFHLDRVRLLDGVPTALDSTLIPVAVLPGWADIDFATASLYDAVTSGGTELVRADSTIEAREASDAIAESLGIAVGKPLLVMHQVVVDASDRPLFVSTINYSGERYRLRTNFARTHAPRR